MEFKEKLQKYARAIIKVGVNIQKNQPLVIRSMIEGRELVHNLVDEAYNQGASEVIVIWRDDILIRKDFENMQVETLEKISDWKIEEYRDYVEKGAAFISIIGSDPNNLEGIDEEKVKRGMVARSKALTNFRKALMNDENSWCVIGSATPSWAKTVFPNLEEKEAIEKLWDLIFYTTRIDENDEIENWSNHITKLKEKAKYLNEMNFKSLKYISENGTNLEIGLPKGHIWVAAESLNSKGISFTANMPTEEVYTMPHKDKVNGIVYSTKPLNFNGNIIDDFYLEFKDGKVINYDAKKGKNTLKSLLESDLGALSLGEVALVPHNSPISNTNTMFFETLYDENASCHLALGKAYPTCIKNGVNLSEEELLENGVNNSLVHEDFMIGNSNLDIIGITQDGVEIPVFIKGNWA